MMTRRTSAEAPERHAHRPRKRFGQHFLEPAWVVKVVDALEATAADVFVEIGPGRGALTRPLAPRVKQLIAVEIDRDLAAQLQADLPSGATVVIGDYLDTDLASILSGQRLPVRVVGNLPYNVSSPILFKLLREAREGHVISDATLMVQKEVADRVIARPGSPEYGVLAVQVGLVADVSRLLTLPPGAFRPPPKVTSSLLQLRFRAPAVDVGRGEVFERIVRGTFLQRRKTLANALKPVADALGRTAADLIEQAGIDGARRPETLTIHEFAALSRAVL